MSTKFNWQTDDDTGWDEPAEPAHAPPQQRRWWLAAVLFVLGSTAVLFFQRQASERLEVVTADLQSDVTAVHDLLQMAAANGDADLVSTMLSIRDPDWTDAQLNLVRAGAFHQRQIFGLAAAPAAPAAPATGHEVTLSPDLQTAEVVVPQTYTTTLPSGETTTITLRQTAVFRQGSRAWLFSPPLPAFWGDWQEIEGDMLTVTYPARDTAVAEQLAADLDELLQRMCQTVADLECPAAYSLRLRLETSPETLQPPGRLVPTLNGHMLTLPTPTLVGLPVDDAGYRAIFRGYAAHLASAAMADIIGYDCCRQAPFYTVLLDWQLSDLGLRPWPPIDIDYDDLSDYWRGDSALDTLWRVENIRSFTNHEYGMYSVSFIDFLRRDGADTVTPMALLHLLGEADSFPEWSADIQSLAADGPILQMRWMQAVSKQAGVQNQEPPPEPFPTGTAEMVCNFSPGTSAQVVTFEPRSQAWTPILTHSFAEGRQGWLNPVPVPNTYVLYSYLDDNGRGSLDDLGMTLYHNGRSLSTWSFTENERAFFHTPRDHSLDNDRYLTLFRYRDDVTSLELVDLENCRDGACDTIPLDGLPVFAPDNDAMLIVQDPESWMDAAGETLYVPLALAGPAGENQQALGNGRSPIWLSANRYAYFRPGDQGGEELVTAVIGQETPTLLLPTTHLLAHLPPDDAATAVTFSLQPAEPLGPERLLLFATYRYNDNEVPGLAPNYVFVVELTPDFDGVAGISLIDAEFSSPTIEAAPGGDRLAFIDYQDGLWLVNVATGEQSRQRSSQINGVAWMSDSWLLINRYNDITLLHLDSGYRRVVPHNLGSCWQARWLPASAEEQE